MENNTPQIVNVVWNEAMLLDLINTVLENNEPSLFILNDQIAQDHPAFTKALPLTLKNRDITDLLSPKEIATPFAQNLLALLQELFEPQFALEQSPYQVNRYLLSLKETPTINFKVSNVLSLSQQEYENSLKELEAIEKEAHETAALPALFSALHFKPEQAAAEQKDLQNFIQAYELLKNVCKSKPFGNERSYNENRFLALQLKKLTEKTSASFRKEQMDALIHFISSLNSHIQFKQSDVYLRWLKQELDEARAIRERFLDAQMKVQVQSEELILKDETLVAVVSSQKKDNPLFLELESVDEWIVKNRPWQKRWSFLDLERLEKIISILEKKTKIYLRQKEKLLREFKEEALDLDAIDMLVRFQNEYTGLGRLFKSSYRQDKKELDSLRTHPEDKWSPEDYEEGLERLINLQKQKNWLEDFYFKSKELFGPLSFNTDFAAVLKQLEFQKHYRKWLKDYHSYKLLEKENRKIERSMKKDFSSLYQDEKTQWQEVAGFLDWLVDFFTYPGQGSFDECVLVLQNSQVSSEWLARVLDVMDGYEKSMESIAPYMSESAFSAFKEKAARTSLNTLTRSFRRLRSVLRHTTAWTSQLDAIKEDNPIYPLLRQLSFSAETIKKISLVDVYAKHVLTNWLFEALLKLVAKYLGSQSNALKDEILKEILHFLDLEARKSQGEDISRPDVYWANQMPYLMQGLYPLWLAMDPAVLSQLRTGPFDSLYFFNDGSFDKNAFYPARMVVVLNKKKPRKPRVVQETPAQPVKTKPAQAPAAKPASTHSAHTEAASTQSQSPAASKIDAAMNQIVAEQYPVHADSVAAQLLSLYKRKRMTPGIRKDIQKDIDANPDIIQKGDYLYPKGYTVVPVRNLKRKLNQISDDEILQALRNTDPSLDDQKRILEAAKQLGFQTTNTSILNKFSELLPQVNN